MAKHKFPFGDLRLSRAVAPAKRLCVGYYLSAGTALADEHAAPFVLDRRIVPRPRRSPRENAYRPPDIDAPQPGSVSEYYGHPHGDAVSIYRTITEVKEMTLAVPALK